MGIVDKARTAATGAGLVGSALSALSLSVEGRPIKEKDKPAKVTLLGLPWFERDENGKQYVLWFRIRDVRK